MSSRKARTKVSSDDKILAKSSKTVEVVQNDHSSPPMVIQFVSADGDNHSEFVYELLQDESALNDVDYVISDQIQIDPNDENVVTCIAGEEGAGAEIRPKEQGTSDVQNDDKVVTQELNCEPKNSEEFILTTEIKKEKEEDDDNESKPAIECQMCFVLFFDHKSYRNHLADFHNETVMASSSVKPKWFCPSCNEYIPMASKKRHTRNCPPGKRYHCSVCDKNFKNTTKLESHLAKEHGEGPTMCDVCGLSLSSRHSLVIHKRKHTGERPYSCDICKKSYTNKTSLTGHNLRQHPTSAPHQCHLCERKYRERSVLTAHIQKKHMNIKRHFCSECGKGFYERKVMISHYNSVHTDARPWPCNLCDVAYKKKDNLRRHMRSTHNIILK